VGEAHELPKNIVSFFASSFMRDRELKTMMRGDRKFAELFKSGDAFARGRRFEKTLADALAVSGFDVDIDSPAATPRQTDLLVERNDAIYLWELKWHSRPATIDHVHGLRDRVRAMRAGVVGVLCSVSGFTKAVLDDVARNRSIEVLLVDGYEICQVIDGGLDVADLLEKKRYQLTRRARVWFLEDRKTILAVKPHLLPATRECLGGSGDTPYVSMTTSGNADLIFTRHPLMFGEYGPGVHVFRLRLDAIEELKDLEQLIGILHKELRFVADPEFSIRQTNAIWAGTGAREFLKCTADVEARYTAVKTRLHHSEELWAFAEIPDGVMVLSLRQRSSSPFQLDSGELIVRVAALPLDLSSYQRLAKAVGERRPSFSIECPLETYRFHLPEPIDIVPLERIAVSEEGERIVTGMFVRNPLYRKPGLLKRIARANQEQQNPRALERLTETDVLGCSVKDWIPESEEVTGWHLLGIDVALVGELWLMHCRCTWKDKKHWKRHTPNDEAVGSIPDFRTEQLSRKEMERALLEWRGKRLLR
jgi:hypothetical protein